MISGFNSDIEFQGTTYHVQTEDKGLNTPIILSLVYSRGEILASKRSPYEDLISAGFNEEELNDRLQRQHKLIIAAIRAGRIEDLKRMTMKESQKKRSSKASESQMDLLLVDDEAPVLTVPPVSPPVSPAASAAPISGEAKVQPEPEPAISSIGPGINFEHQPAATPSETFIEPAPEPKAESKAEPAVERTVGPVPEKVQPETAEPSFENLPIPSPIPKPAGDLVVEIPIDIIEEPFFEEVEIVEYGIAEEETILPAEAVKILTDYVGVEEVDESKLKIRLLGRTTFRSGEDATLDILVAKGGKLGRGVSGAHIMVKVVGSSFKPQIFHTRADDNGITQLQLQIPEVRSGRAAIIIKALHDGEEIELRQVIAQR